MRQGVLLAEAPPEDLIKEYQASTLEEVFLQLCYKQNQNQHSEQDNNNNNAKIMFKNPYKDKSQHISAVWPHTQAILYKILTWCKRNLAVFMALSFGLSVVCIVFCNEMMTDFPPTTVGFVNHESGGDCEDPIFYNKTLSCERLAEYENLGCRFIRNWRIRNPKMAMVYYPKFEDAMYDGQKTKIAAVLEIPEIFSQGISARISQGRKADPDLIGNSTINVWGDTTDYMRTLKVEVEIQASFLDMYRSLITSCGYDKRVADMPPMRVSRYF
ncbi:hypothetical protein WDU94_010078 [Cyamophila willieti]